MTLLIVEDNPHMRRLLRQLVSRWADAVYECDGGAQALSAYAAHRPDWVLMDIEMPEMDGLTATRQITAAFPEARIVIVTQYDDQMWREVAREAGALEYVVKDDLSGMWRILAPPPLPPTP